MSKHLDIYINEEDVIQDIENNELESPYIAIYKYKKHIKVQSKSRYEILLETPLTFEIITPGTLYWKKASSSIPNKTIQYKKNNGDWTSITTTTSGAEIQVSAGDKVAFRGNNATYANSNDYHVNFAGSSTLTYNVYGNIMSLIQSTDFKYLDSFSMPYALNYLFVFCTGMINASNLIMPAITLTDACYGSMFNGCTNLIATPELPAKTMASGCYSGMFFNDSSLSVAPELPATELAERCYAFMFYNCSNLIQSPELNADTLKYLSYDEMFNGCTKLNYIKCLATNISAQQCLDNWVRGVSSTGTFIKHPNTTWPSGINGIPSGWTVQNVN